MDPININRLAQLLYEERLREFENGRYNNWEPLAVRPKAYAQALAGLGRGLIALGQKLQAQSQIPSGKQRAPKSV